MEILRNKYNPEETQKKADNCLSNVSEGEMVSWLQHPCTTALKYQIESNLDDLVLAIIDGGALGRTIEETALSQHRAIGSADALNGVMEYINSLLENTHREDPYEKALHEALGQ